MTATTPAVLAPITNNANANVTWTPSDPDVEGYIIYGAIGGSSVVLRTIVPGQSTTNQWVYEDPTLLYSWTATSYVTTPDDPEITRWTNKAGVVLCTTNIMSESSPCLPVIDFRPTLHPFLSFVYPGFATINFNGQLNIEYFLMQSPDGSPGSFKPTISFTGNGAIMQWSETLTNMQFFYIATNASAK